MKLSILTRAQSKTLQLPAFAGFKIPYFDLEGKTLKFFRVRYLEDTREGFDKSTEKKPIRYIQPPGTGVELYIPPLITWKKVLDADGQIIITEGELKAACACKLGLPSIGLGGVWSFRATSRGEMHLPGMSALRLKGRAVYIIFDSDAATNPQVMKAEQALARSLLSLGAHPRIVRLPALPDRTKTGMDDYLMAKSADELLRLMEEAPAFAQAARLYELNTLVAYVKDPGLIVQLNEMQRMTPAAFTQHAYSTWTYPEAVPQKDGSVAVEERPAAPAWLKWPSRFEVKRITYSPGEGKFLTETNEINTWPGWGCGPPKKGNVKPWTDLLDHLFREDPPARAWFERWCACPFQQPGIKLFTAAVLWSTETGVGKSLIGYTLMKLYGEKNSTEISDQDLAASYNEWAENKQFVMGDDVTGEDKRGMADRLKFMITRKALRLNPKYIPSYTIRDCINYYFTSNHPDALFMDDRDRRYFIHETTEQKLTSEFYKTYVRWMESEEGQTALFHHLLNLPMGGFDPAHEAHLTEAKREMIDNTRSDLATWCRALYSEPEQLLGSEYDGDLWTPQELLRLYDPEGKGRVTPAGMGRELKRTGFRPPNISRVYTTKYGSVRLVVVRHRDKWKKLAEKKGVFNTAVEHYEASRGVPTTESEKRKKKYT